MLRQTKVGPVGGGGRGTEVGGRGDARGTSLLLTPFSPSSSFPPSSFLGGACHSSSCYLCYSSSTRLPSILPILLLSLLLEAKASQGVHCFLAVVVEEERGEGGSEDEEEGEERQGLIQAEEGRGEGGGEVERAAVGREGGRKG